jgi:peptidoglycan/LPS O-acetylase OafA/YrhL
MNSIHQQSPKVGRGKYVPILDGWRAVAISLVLLFHGLHNTNTMGSKHLATVAVLASKIGTLGVLIFFCISGYLITRNLFEESRIEGNFSFYGFYIKRIFRILPLVAAYLLVLLALFAAGAVSLVKNDWSAPLFLTNYLPGSWYTTHFWSLSVEEHFYLFWPLCIIVCGWRRAMWVGVILILAVGVWRPWHLHQITQVQATQHIDMSVEYAKALQHTDMRLDYIMMGCVVLLLTAFHPSATRILGMLGSTLGLTALFIALLISTRPWPVDMRSVQAAILTLMVCGSSVANSRFVGALLANPVMLYLGRISYSIYIWQQLVLGPSSHAFLRSPAALLLKYSAVIAIASLSFYFIEKPFIAYGRRLLERRKLPILAKPVANLRELSPSDRRTSQR